MKYPNPLHTFSNDSNDNNIPSQIKNHHYLIKTLPHFDTAPSHQRKLISKHHQLQTDKIVFQTNSTLIVNELWIQFRSYLNPYLKKNLNLSIAEKIFD